MKRGKAKAKDKDRTTGSSATWTSADEVILVQTLKEAKAEGDWGDNNPKKNVWTTCERALVGSEKISGGAPKNQGAIKNRWQHACYFLRTASICTDYFIISSLRKNMRS
jgi:hypothetical protein